MKHKIFSLLVALMLLVGIDAFASVQPTTAIVSKTPTKRFEKEKEIEGKQIPSSLSSLYPQKNKKEKVRVEKVEVTNNCIIIVIVRTYPVLISIEDIIIEVEITEITVAVIC